jgi:hypothetical protein
VEDVAGGKYASLDEARHRNGIRGGSTLSRRRIFAALGLAIAKPYPGRKNVVNARNVM